MNSAGLVLTVIAISIVVSWSSEPGFFTGYAKNTGNWATHLAVGNN